MAFSLWTTGSTTHCSNPGGQLPSKGLRDWEGGAPSSLPSEETWEGHTEQGQKRTEVRSEELPLKVVPPGFGSTWRPLLQQHLGCPTLPNTHLGLCPPRPADSPPTSFAQMKSLSVPGAFRASCLVFMTSSFTHSFIHSSIHSAMPSDIVGSWVRQGGADVDPGATGEDRK